MPGLMIIGTAHVIDLSLSLEKYIRDFNPQIIALELDKHRWHALRLESRRTEGPFYLRLLARLQQYLGDSLGSSPGSEMIVATNIADSIGAGLAFIDKPIIHTIQDAWKNMPYSELFRLFTDSLVSFVGGGSTNVRSSIQTGDFSTELHEFGKFYPSLKDNLIDRRDQYMSLNIVRILRTNKCEKLLAVVGEGHVEGMATRLSKLKPQIVKLSDLLQYQRNSVSFTVEI